MMSAYLIQLQGDIAAVTHLYPHLFASKSLETLKKVSSLDENAQLLLARLMIRKGEWLRSSSFEKYVVDTDSSSSSTSNFNLLNAMEKLSAVGILHELNSTNSLNLPFDEVW